MKNLQVDISNALPFLAKDAISSQEKNIVRAYDKIYRKTGAGSDFLGWTDLPGKIGEELIEKIESIADEIRSKADLFVVIGIGGSYLGARAVIEALGHHFESLISRRKNPLILYAGQNISEGYMANLLEVLEDRDYALAVISKSGTTTEPAIAFRLIREHLEGKYGKQEASKRIIAITDKTRGALKELADNEGYTSFVVPDDVGGRYSVLTPVGLVPIAVAGIDIRKLIKGASYMEDLLRNHAGDVNDNPVSLYAATRNALYEAQKLIEIMVSYEPGLFYLTEWWKQLYGESEGKQNKGIFPAGAGFTTDLHSMGQYIQEGKRHLFETVISVETPKNRLLVPSDQQNLDKLNYLSGKRLSEVNQMAELGTLLAHVEGGVPNIKISIPGIDEEALGQLIYFFEMACAVSGYLLDVNPFDQPGVEAYKKNMFALLGKPGFEKETAAINKKIRKD
jgi:glucose-6-phosphate isomerase